MSLVSLPNITYLIYTVSQKNDIDVAHYNFDADQPILIIFGRDVAERVCYQMAILFCYPTSPNSLMSALYMNLGNRVFSVMLYTVSRKRNG